MVMRRLKVDLLKVGDIIFTTTNHFQSKVIRTVTQADISHAMLYVSHSSIIHASGTGVQSQNVQRIFFEPGLAVHVMRVEGLDPVVAQRITDQVRSVVGTQYSVPEAAWAATTVGIPYSSKQFCSRLVAQAYELHGLPLVKNAHYCNPGQLMKSPKLSRVDDPTEEVSDEEYAKWLKHPSQIGTMESTTNYVLDGARKLDKKIQSLNDLDFFIMANPEHDDVVDRLYHDSGFLDVYKPNLVANPWQYDGEKLEALGQIHEDRVRSYCRGTTTEGRSQHRYVQTLAGYRDYDRRYPRLTFKTMIRLYEMLVYLHMQRMDVAEDWLNRHGR